MAVSKTLPTASKNVPWLLRGWHGRTLLSLVGLAYLVIVLLNLAWDGGLEYAILYGPIGFVATFPILVGIGCLAAAGLNRLVPLRDRSRGVIVVAPVVLLSGLLAYDTHLNRNPIRKLERHLRCSAPPSLRVASAYTYSGFNYRDWAFHFSVARDDFPKILEARPYRHETDLEGFDLEQRRENGRQRAGYPIPPQEFRAVHRYQFDRPNDRLGYSLTLYGDATQTEFFAFGYAE